MRNLYPPYREYTYYSRKARALSMLKALNPKWLDKIIFSCYIQCLKPEVGNSAN